MHRARTLGFNSNIPAGRYRRPAGLEVAAVFSVEEKRILREIERGLREDDRWFATRLTVRSAVFSLCRRWVLALLGAELALAGVAVTGLLINQPALIVLGAGIGVVTAMAVVMIRLAMTDPPDASGDPPPIMWLW